MRLTALLLRYKVLPPRGHIYRGKYRIVKEVKPYHIAKQRLLYEREERNMFYLRHPYLTIEQSGGHGRLLGHYKQFIDRRRVQLTENWKDNRLLGDTLGFLKVTESWD